MKKMFFVGLLVAVFLSTPLLSSVSFAGQNVGIVAVVNSNGHYLQAHGDNGEMHASNDKRSTEETWVLIKVDESKHIYALQNWATGRVMSKHPNGTIQGQCVPAYNSTLDRESQWVLISGVAYGAPGKIAFKSVYDNTFLGAMPKGGDNAPGCGGEVSATSVNQPPKDLSSWTAWWEVRSAQPPGGSIIGTIADGVGGIVPIAENVLPLLGL